MSFNNILSNIKIIDFTRLFPGALATLLLQDFGADVIKIESLPFGDYMRYIPPYFKDISIYFVAFNRGKKSLAVDLNSPQSIDILYNLIKKSHVIIESYRPHFMKKFKLDYELIKKINPQIIYCSLTGFGQTGTLSNKRAHDLNILAEIGALFPESNKKDRLLFPFVPFADIAGGALFSVIAILLALIKYFNKKEGSFIDISMFDNSLFLTSINYLGTLFNIDNFINPLSGLLPFYTAYKIKNQGFLCVATIEDKFWFSFLKLLGLEQLKNIDRFDPNNWKSLYQSIYSQLQNHDIDYWENLFENANICVNVAKTFNFTLNNNPHLIQRNLVTKINDDFKIINNPLICHQVKHNYNYLYPMLGQHNEIILTELGYSEKQIRQLRESHTII